MKSCLSLLNQEAYYNNRSTTVYYYYSHKGEGGEIAKELPSCCGLRVLYKSRNAFLDGIERDLQIIERRARGKERERESESKRERERERAWSERDHGGTCIGESMCFLLVYNASFCARRCGLKASLCQIM